MKTILVVDDEEAVVEFIALLLEDVGYRILRAYDGRSALEIARNEHPDLVITDIMMPIMSGLELCNRIRKDPEIREIPVVLMTAGRAPEHDCPGAPLLPKPFDLAKLEEIIACMLPPVPAG